MKSTDHALETVRERSISRGNLTRLLDDLEKRDVVNGTTIYSRPGHFNIPTPTCGHTSLRGSAQEAMVRTVPRLEGSVTGSVVFWSEGSGLAVLPPFPVERNEALNGWDASPLRTLLSREYMLGVVLLRLGRFAIGVFQGETLLSSKTDTRYVKGRHSAGGSHRSGSSASERSRSRRFSIKRVPSSERSSPPTRTGWTISSWEERGSPFRDFSSAVTT